VVLFLHFFRLAPSFFGLTYEYNKNILDEIYICKTQIGFGYTEVMKMPTYKRRYFLGLLNRKKERQSDNPPVSIQNGKGSKTTILSGEALKTQMMEGKIY
jgi:hypothetical protein